ncbi:MAG: hypothetical protein COU35_00670 [Candidatus Magasanikbacteria bacterium CG10_big_fil_rev_8_21_14_0_10_47_10]|uniref:Ribosome-binding factor A n=1 Tax=Candidatus Magasanikbacteria bacterium CG10_big_fil_rev_8_21_14_0_10_47_10 TaxID=1974652 RepID=A0A2H0TRJ7_9BACT|nr:MAG: hypothetical protein COU35_00670 [Candidatus Magasanikbacteria bacterium CG10_big_fil_rev_8_21_14_0_10_47_10]
MVDRMEKVNKEILRVVGQVVSQEAALPSDVLVTITRAEATRNLRSVTVRLSVLPAERSAAVLAALQAQLYDLQGSFNGRIALHPLPRITLALDVSAAYAVHLPKHHTAGSTR